MKRRACARRRSAGAAKSCGNTRIEYASLGDYSYLGENCEVADAVIGKFTAIANSVRIGAPNHPMGRPSQHRFTYCPEYYEATATRDRDFFAERRGDRVIVGNDVLDRPRRHPAAGRDGRRAELSVSSSRRLTGTSLVDACAQYSGNLRRLAAQIRRRVERLAVDRAIVVLARERRVADRRRKRVVLELAVARQHFGAGIEPGARGDVDAGARPCW